MNYGRALRVARAARGMSQKDLAARAHIEPSYVSLLEAGKRGNPSSRLLKQIADALGVPLDLLILLAAEDSELRGVTTTEAARLGEAMLFLLQEHE